MCLQLCEDSTIRCPCTRDLLARVNFPVELLFSGCQVLLDRDTTALELPSASDYLAPCLVAAEFHEDTAVLAFLRLAYTMTSVDVCRRDLQT